MKKYKIIDLFAGIGGIRLGFERVFGDRCEFVFASDNDPVACDVYEKNFGENPMNDIRLIDAHDILDHDILLAGIPCQAFSMAGKQMGFADTRGTLFFEVARILNAKMADVFLLENVKHLVNHDHGRTFEVMITVLRKLGYTVYHKVLNAKHFGLPQNRPRVFIVGFKKRTEFDFGVPIYPESKLSDILQKSEEVDDGWWISQKYLSGLKRHRSRHESKGHGFGYIVLDNDGVSNTLVCGGMGVERNLICDSVVGREHKNNEGIRKLTITEQARLQGFPDDFKWATHKSGRVLIGKNRKLIANSVAVPCIEYLAKLILDKLEE